MIVACPSCSARFRVADEKIGPQGAKVRCSKCQKVFGVRRDAEAPPRPPRAAPASTDLDLEPAARAAPSPFGAVAPPDDPFAPQAAPAPAPLGSPPPPPDDPFAAFHEVAAASAPPPALPTRPPPLPAPTAEPPAFPSFDQAGTADLLASTAAAPPPAPARLPLDDGLSLEEPAARPPRPPPRPPEPAADGWLGELAGGELEGRPGEVASFPDVIPDGVAGFETGSFSAPSPSASIAVQTGTMEQPPPRTAQEEVSARRRASAAAGTAEAPDGGPGRGARLRVALIDTFALAVLLLAALALAAVWRGGPSPAEALRPASLLAVLTHRAAAGPFEASEVQSAFYERRRGPPLLFVRGLVTSRAAAASGPVRISVDLVRDGQVLAHLEGRAGGPLGPEALAQVEDAASLARLAEAAAAAAPASFEPGQTLPFLVALADVPPGLEGAAIRVAADAEGPR